MSDDLGAEVHRFEVEVECRFAGTTTVDAESAEEALKIVEDLPDAEIITNDLTPGSVETRGVYELER